VHKIAIFSDELENVKQLNFSLQKFESDNIEFEKKCSDLHNSLQEEICLKGVLLAKNQNLLSSSGKSWYEDLLDDGLKSTLTVCPSVLSNFKYWGTRP
jgi:beta-glucosidase-like glycosyl hydrolase